MQPVAWTSGPEVGAFIAAQALRIVVQYALGMLVLGPLYRQVIAATGSAVWIAPIGFGSSALCMALAFPVFLGLRAGFGEVPAIVTGRRGERGFTTSGAEVGAYALAGVAVFAVAAAASMLLLPRIFLAFRNAGLLGAYAGVSLALSAVYALLFLGLFILLRGAFSGGRR